MKTKKIFIIALSLACVFTSLCANPAISVQAARTKKSESSATQSVKVSQSDVAHGIYDFDNSSASKSGVTTNSMVSSSLLSSNDLICAVQLTLTRSGASLSIYGNTRSDSEMSEIGFTNITIQREINGTWSNYSQWSNLYEYNTYSHSEGKTFSVPTGYYYRAIANHYAEKPSFLWFKDKQTYYNQTTTLYM